jgi:Glycosyl transferase family 2
VTPLLLIPAHDERATIGAVVARARCHGHVLLVDDGSADGTGAAASVAGAEVLRHARRLGKAQALRTGIAAARSRGASHVVTLDGDGQHDPDDIPALLAAAAPRTIVVGGRLDDTTAVSPERLDAIRVAGFFASWASGLRVRDTQSGFRLYPLPLFDAVPTHRGGFVFETEVLLAAAARGWVVREVSVRARPRAASRSRFRPVADGVAIGAFVARWAVARFGVEAADGVAELVSVFRAPRRRARHAAMLEAAAPYGGGPGWGLAIGAAAAQRFGTCINGWRHHPRTRRTAAAATAALALPLVLPVLLAQGLAGRRLSDAVTDLIESVYAQERLYPADSIEETSPSIGVDTVPTGS